MFQRISSIFYRSYHACDEKTTMHTEAYMIYYTHMYIHNICQMSDHPGVKCIQLSEL